jgi:hypothetical protein
MTIQRETRAWAEDEFGMAKLGDARRVKRLVRIAAEAMNRPAGEVTAVFDEGAAREGTFRLLENDDVDPEQIAQAAHRATARRSAQEPYVFVAVDGTSLNLTDTKRTKRLGIVGARYVGASGLQVMTALALSPEGVPMGLCGQRYWARSRLATRDRSQPDHRPVAARETQHCLDVMNQARAALGEAAPATKAWFQIDRAGDAWPVLLDGLKDGELCTVRAAHDRRLTRVSKDEPKRYLWEVLERQKKLGVVDLDLGARPAKKIMHLKTRPARRGRRARIELRACEVSLDLLVEVRRRSLAMPVYALLAQETQKSAGNEAPIEWMLLTSYPVVDLESAKLTLFGYAQRWRIEEFHKSWKSGACKVEDTQLRDIDHIIRWATVLASVAARIVRLSYLARHEADKPALDEFARAEIDAILIASRARGHRPGSDPGVGVIVALLARLGGYTGRSSGGPPGPLVLARGLLKIEALALALESGLVHAKM